MNIPLFEIMWDENDVDNVTSAIKSGKNWAIGENITQFENNISSFTETKHALTFNSGTSALHSLLIAHGVGKGDEVIVPSFTFISTVNAVLFVGATPIFMDIEKTNYGIDPEKLEDKITDKSKAIISVHYAGCPCQIDKIKKIADSYNIILIEDAAEAMGAKLNDKYVGTFGDSAILSFCQNKIITTGEGGAIITNSDEIYEKLLLLRSHGRLETKGNYFDSDALFKYIDLGYNFRMSNLTAALGISQLNKINNILNLRIKKAEYLIDKLSTINQIQPMSPPKNYNHVYQLFSCYVENRDDLLNYLSKNGISSKVYFDPVHLTPFYQSMRYDTKLPVTEDVGRNIISLPFFPTISYDQLNFIVENIIKFYEGV